MPYVAGRNYYRQGVLVKQGEPVPEVEEVSDIVLDRLLRLNFVREAPRRTRDTKESTATPIKGRPPLQKG